VDIEQNKKLVACGDTVVGRWSATGTHTGPLGALAPTGKALSIGVITI
jgi:predicted ester cyclase